MRDISSFGSRTRPNLITVLAAADECQGTSWASDRQGSLSDPFSGHWPGPGETIFVSPRSREPRNDGASKGIKFHKTPRGLWRVFSKNPKLRLPTFSSERLLQSCLDYRGLLAHQYLCRRGSSLFLVDGRARGEKQSLSASQISWTSQRDISVVGISTDLCCHSLELDLD